MRSISRPGRPVGFVSAALLLASCSGSIGSLTIGGSDPGSGGASGGGAGSGGPSAGTHGQAGGATGQPGGASGQAGGASGGGGGAGGAAVPGPLESGFARLTRAEYRATIRDAFGLDPDVSGIPEDGRVGPFTSNLGSPTDPVQPFLLASEDLAAAIVPGRLPACSASSASTCLASNYQRPFERLFRRPLLSTELTAWSTMLGDLERAGLGAQDATRSLVTSALLHPDAMFRTTPLSGDAARARRLAEHLGYALWDAPPDAELQSAAQGSAPDLGARLRTEAQRLGKNTRAAPVLARFLAQWLHLDLDLRLADAGYATSPLYLELVAYVQDALANDAPVTSLVNGTRGFVHRNNLAAYGLAAAPGAGDVSPVTWPATSPRRGMIGQETIMDPTRHPDTGRRAIFRGVLVRSSLLCQPVPPPSAENVAMAGTVSDRTADARCAACHLLLEPVGAAFAALDRDFTGTPPPVQVNNHPELAGTYPQLADLLDAIAGSQAFADCFARHVWGFFLERPLSEVDAGSVAEIAAIVRRGGSLAEVLGQLATSLEARSRALVPWCSGQ